MTLIEKVKDAVIRRKKRFECYKAEYESMLMEEVVVLKWLLKGKPDSFRVPSFENFGHLLCVVQKDPEDGMTYIKVMPSRLNVKVDVDVQDILFRIQEEQ